MNCKLQTRTQAGLRVRRVKLIPWPVHVDATTWCLHEVAVFVVISLDSDSRIRCVRVPCSSLCYFYHFWSTHPFIICAFSASCRWIFEESPARTTCNLHAYILRKKAGGDEHAVGAGVRIFDANTSLHHRQPPYLFLYNIAICVSTNQSSSKIARLVPKAFKNTIYKLPENTLWAK